MKSFIGNNDKYRYPPESVGEKVEVVDVFDDDGSPVDSDSLSVCGNVGAYERITDA